MVEPKRRRSKNSDALNVWVNGVCVGTWFVHKKKPQRFQYADEWVASPQGRMLSLSLPFLPGNPAFEGDL